MQMTPKEEGLFLILFTLHAIVYWGFFTLLYYYITSIAIIQFPIKLFSLLKDGFDSIAVHYIKEGIQLSVFRDSVYSFNYMINEIVSKNCHYKFWHLNRHHMYDDVCSSYMFLLCYSALWKKLSHCSDI